jgi:hypothetical protein
MTQGTAAAATLLHELETAPVEEIAPGFKVKRLFDRRILYVIAETSHRAVVDSWTEFMSSVITNWPDDRTYLAVQDLSSPKFSITPYVRARASETYEVRPALKGRVALILPKTFVGQMIQMFIRGEKRNHFETRYFGSSQEALLWLAQELPEATS